MTLWFIRGIRRGVVTTRYPARPEESARYLPAPPVFRPEALSREVTNRVVAVCPSRALWLEEGRDRAVLVYDVGRCTACGRCVAAAPSAVSAGGEWELATMIRSVLIKRIPIGGAR